MSKKLNIGGVITEPGSTKHYKTGDWRIFRPYWDKTKCIQCMKCWQFCPDISIPQKDGKRQDTDFEFCKGCGICAKECPVKCIVMNKEKK